MNSIRDNLKTPTAFNPKAEGWEVRSTLGIDQNKQPTLGSGVESLWDSQNRLRL
jgi:hypothetical protein